jgi:hypothetical protein
VNSMNALKKPEGCGKVFLASEYWEGGDETQRDALVLGYGVLYQNGNDGGEGEVCGGRERSDLWGV